MLARSPHIQKAKQRHSGYFFKSQADTHSFFSPSPAPDGRVQRTIGDGHDLSSPRFAGNERMEAAYDDERYIRKWTRGDHVRRLQQALVDDGQSLPRFGVDGIFGPETDAAVRAYQSAHGLQVDGIVGPETMGDLDRRFPAPGPTPAPPTPAPPAPAPCPKGIKTITVDFVSLRGSTHNPLNHLALANQIFRPCCVQVQIGTGVSVDPTVSDTWLGGDTDLQRIHSCSTAHAEENAMRVGATGSFGLSARFRAFYVASMTPALRGVSFPQYCSSGTRAPFRNHLYVANQGAARTLAHELGHILLNSGAHPANSNNLMHPSNTATGNDLTPAQCATIFANA